MNLNLTNVNEVPANKLIEILALKLKDEEIVKPPEWSDFVKPGSHADRPPQHNDWWYERCASVVITSSFRLDRFLYPSTLTGKRI